MMFTRSQSVKNCKVEKVSEKKPLRSLSIVRTRSHHNRVEKLQTNTRDDVIKVEPYSRMVTRAKSNAASTKPRLVGDQMILQDVTIDFDGASREWRKNKRSIGNGSYIYK